MIIYSYFFNINNIFLIEDAITIILEPILCLECESEDFQFYLIIFHSFPILIFLFFHNKR
jgi:hypothetical protein